MSPQSLRSPSPASGDVAEAGGRHRRPESLADTRRTGPEFRVSTLLEDGAWVPGPRSARHHAGRAEGAAADVSRRSSTALADSSRRSSTALGDSSRRSSTALADSSRRSQAAPRSVAHRSSRARHAAAHRAPADTRPPVTGSHRAPGTLPIESWLLMGKKRQQVLLASLVAVGLLLVAVPGARARDGVDAVNAAAQRAIGVHSTQTKKKSSRDTAGDTAGATSGAKKTPQQAGDKGAGAPAAVPSASAAASGSGVPAGGATAPSERRIEGAGPGNSLRTTGSATVALTFDDGPDAVQTPRILALLAKYQVKATFCLVGQQAQKHPEIVRDIVAAGHTLCNHTWNHSLTIGKDKPEDIQADLERTNAAIRAAVPDAQIPFFRAPGGNFTDRLVGVAATAGMTSLYWQVDPADWDHKPGETDAAHTDRVIAEVKKHARPGSIILSHDFNQPDTIAAYENLLPWLKENFTLGIPSRPAPAETTAPTTAPTPESPATPNPSASVTPPAPASPTAPVPARADGTAAAAASAEDEVAAAR
ncbi:polysaccharide deacetylase family protein [Actinoplanes sp. CA-030573]|uniref:polysaccharide deacetylase family protein n=1 Tax=Actinoplanes sp. CA-030573 TaxID=3239898 RepID=UPI003D8FFB79